MVSHLVAGVLGVVLGGAGAESGYNFLVLGGGGRPERNEIALEKNVLYFQRTLQAFGLEPASATFYFANGDDGQETVRYLDENFEERFKAPEIPHLKGPSTRASFQEWVSRTLQEKRPRPIFLYFTGHGGLNEKNPDNNALSLWDKRSLSVRALARALDRLSPDTPVVTVMSQCYAGSFASFIHQGGDPQAPVASQPRCGFFATVRERTSVGCTPEVDEADYRDYSSSFFSGLSGYSRVGRPVASADYDQDGLVSFSEAHAFAKVDGKTSDLPISTSEAWLMRKVRQEDEDAAYSQALIEVLPNARPEQRHVIESLAQLLGIEQGLSLKQSDALVRRALEDEVQGAYVRRLWMELLSVSVEARLRREQESQGIVVLDRLLACEQGSWLAPPAVAAFPEEGARPEVPGVCVSGEDEGGAPHRIATRTSKRETEQRAAWTPRFEALFAQAGMSLEDPLNLIYLQEHAPSHPESYHQEIFELLQATMEGCGDQETCRGVLRMALRRLAAELCTPDTPLSSLVSW